MAQVDLDKLSTADIKKLWQQTTARAKQHAEQSHASPVTDVTGDGDDYYIDGFGNAIPGKRPTKKEVKTFVDSDGYIREIGENESVPEKGGLISWLNNVDVTNDPEVREALGEEALYFEHEVAEGDARVLLVGTLGKNGWNVSARSQSEDCEDFRFRLPKQLTRETAIAEAEQYALKRLGPQLKTLSENEERMCERLAATDRLSAFVFYLSCRLPDKLADEFLQVGNTGNELAILKFASSAQISSLAEEAVAHAFYWANPKATAQFFDFVRARDEGRLWTFALLDSLWQQYTISFSIERLTQDDPPTAEELDNLSDEQVSDLLTRARRLKNQTR